MIFNDFPELQWLKKQANNRFVNRQGWKGAALETQGWPTVILNVPTTKTFRDNIRGPLSIFTNIKGTSSVQCGSQRALIHEDFFFVTNQDQHYTLDINSQTPTETFNIHFGEHWADQIFQSLSQHPDKLLDDSFFSTPHQRIELFNKLYYKDENFNRLVSDLKTSEENKLLEEEKLYELLIVLLAQDSQIRKKIQDIPALKNSTRQEILRRLLISTDYVYSYYHKDLSLEELASVSCLSKFHFLRLFKIAFGKTPHQFIIDVKVQQAKVMLKNPTFEVNIIAKQLGFTNASSFSRMFYNHQGLYPSQYR